MIVNAMEIKMRTVNQIMQIIHACNRKHNARKLSRIQGAYKNSLSGHPYQAEVAAWYADLDPLRIELREALVHERFNKALRFMY